MERTDLEQEVQLRLSLLEDWTKALAGAQQALASILAQAKGWECGLWKQRHWVETLIRHYYYVIQN